MLDFLPYLLVSLLYLAVALDFWRAAQTAKSTGRPSWHAPAVAIGLVLHGGLLYFSLFGAGWLNLGLTNALSAILWLTVLIYWLANLKLGLQSLQAFVLPLAALFVLLQKLLPEAHLLPYADRPLFMAHLAIAMLAYSLFTFAALHALLMMVAERNLHRQHTVLRLPDFPPLIDMELLLFRIIGLGFVLLTLTLASGILFSEQLFHKALLFNHKNVFTIISWLIFGALLAGRKVYGWRGRIAIRWTLSGFAVLMLAYVGSKFVLEVLLQRT
jgi:ABC-type uncharacterized transport system permease subunit